MALSAEDHTDCLCVDPLDSSDRSPSRIRPIGALGYDILCFQKAFDGAAVEILQGALN